mmetsp:Transcript_3133/g.7301  ORF Transcript_3133/g.7301 Transcript_3133/m.7301 type:complete len:217 (+) Transcript_3133:117-767(+)|eukprot:CAMPEP_0178998436 /NCGR_PEP_ID=MMETSP0795-20121207/9510_1 /TAXON_ID=88552 /ORGANISM="Amoebophrya sp., Strain Ameob2" /LENGTH=216 /DNA_ID=CAMNT_0020691111 /DNA_START=55 /DNA_END=705 /DNA_ORIENTATION=-
MATYASHADVVNVSNEGLQRIAVEKQKILQKLQEQYVHLISSNKAYAELNDRIEMLEKLVHHAAEGTQLLKSAALWGLSHSLRDAFNEVRKKEELQEKEKPDGRLDVGEDKLENYRPVTRYVMDPVENTKFTLRLESTNDMVLPKVRYAAPAGGGGSANTAAGPQVYHATGPTFASQYQQHNGSYVSREHFSRIFAESEANRNNELTRVAETLAMP